MLLEKLHFELIFSHVPGQRLVAILLRYLTRRAVCYHEYEITFGITSKLQLRWFEFPGIVIPYSHPVRSNSTASTRTFSYLQLLWRPHLASSFYVFMTFFVIAWLISY